MDIERELDRWLGPGDDVLPARAMDAALARIDLTPQRRARSVPSRRTDPMTLLRLAAAAALIALVTAGLFVAGGGPRPDDGRSSAPAVSAPVQAPAATASPSPTSTATASPPGPTPTPIWTSPPLSARFTSPSVGYSMPLPAGYDTEAGKGEWNYYAPPQDAAPWQDTISSPDHLLIMTARSAKLGRAMTTDEWLEAFLASPNAPYSADDCKVVEWEQIPIGGTTGRYYHEPCGLLWAVVADGDRGYVFTLLFNVYDTPYLADPFEAAFKAMLAGTELTPGTATD
ncbi:MAG TPA: hypothetical protein VFN41_09035 [Candidatus Limnocylindrales bacterium]|nr:hypothetical protein [Candidatus Limnocylindrales bacterium]